MAKENKARSVAPQQQPAQAQDDFANRMPAGAIGNEIDSGDVESIIKFDVGDELQGRYRGFKKTRSSKPDEQSTLHKFETLSGEAVGVWGSYQLDAKLAKVQDGDWVWMLYLGKQRMQSGNEMHAFKVVKIVEPKMSAPLPVGRDDLPF